MRLKSFLRASPFVAPWIIGFLAFSLYPLVASIYFSFCDYDALTPPIWVGLLNYWDLIHDSVFWLSLGNTMLYAIFALPLGLILSLLLALLLQACPWGQTFFRSIYFLPSILPLTAVAILWMWIFNGSFGLLNYGLEMIGLSGPNWLADAQYIKPALIIASLWQVGGTIVIFQAALGEVPQQLYEAARIDGASMWGRFVHVTVPMISPVIYFNFIVGLINSLQIFVLPFVMLGGPGTDRAGLFYATYLYQNAFNFNQMGYACAMGWLLFLIIVTLSWLATRASRKHVHYAAE